MQDRGQVIKVNLTLLSQFVDGAKSSNLVLEIKGTQFPTRSYSRVGILIPGTLDRKLVPMTMEEDSSVFEAFRMLKELGYKPKRTLRFIAWSGEESGSYVDGAAQYTRDHKNELALHVAAFESDLGSTLLQGFGY